MIFVDRYKREWVGQVDWVNGLVGVIAVIIGVWLGHYLSCNTAKNERNLLERDYLDKCVYSIYAEINENIKINIDNEDSGGYLHITPYVIDSWDSFKSELFRRLLDQDDSIYDAIKEAYVLMRRSNSYMVRASGNEHMSVFYSNANSLTEKIKEKLVSAVVRLDQVKELSLSERFKNQ